MNSRTFALILGVILLLAGIAGFIPGLTMHGTPDTGLAPGDPSAAPTEAAVVAYPYLLGLFPVNLLHNLFHIAWGVFGIAAYRGLGGARMFARATAVVYGLLTVLGLIPGFSTVFGILPLFGHDVWLHAVIAIAAAYFGWATGTADARPAMADTTATAQPADPLTRR